MNDFRFGTARNDETIVHGAWRPAYPAKSVNSLEPVREWIDFMARKGIRRVCCLLSPEQLAYYHPDDLLEEYRSQFGASNVCSAPIEDYHLCDECLLDTVVMPFLIESDEAAMPVVVHCSGGSGRTGHVLAAWLVRHRGLPVDDALAAVIATGRNPREAVGCGNASEDELRRLLLGSK
jgi:protein-tyrosine phosphatase